MKNIYFLISSIKNSLERQKLITSVPYSKLNIQILELLFQDGYIIAYNRSLECPSLITVKLRFTLGNFLNSLKFYSLKSTNRHLSKEEIIHLSGKVKYGIVTSASSKIVSLSRAKDLKIGGQILFTF